MRSALVLVGLFLPLAGCCKNSASLGWRFEVGRPAVATVPLVLQQGSGDITAYPLGTMMGSRLQQPVIDYQAQPYQQAPLRSCNPMGAPLKMPKTTGSEKE